MRKATRYGLSFSVVFLMLVGVGVYLDKIILVLIPYILCMISCEFTLKTMKEYAEVDALSKILSKLSLSPSTDTEVIQMRQNLVSQTTFLQRCIYRIEFGRRLK